MIHYINYASIKFAKQQALAKKFALMCGGFDAVTTYKKECIDDKFYAQYEHILSNKRGDGYWLWKPYFIHKKLMEVEYGDYVFYCDSGAIFLKNVNVLVYELEKHKQDLMAFELPLISSQWTKKELFINMGCDAESFKNANMVMAGFHLVKKTKFSVAFYKEFLKYSSEEINITDRFDGVTIQEKDFIEHRHDQSVFSLLYKKYNLRPFKDATQYGNYPEFYLLNGVRKYSLKKYAENYSNVLFLYRGDNLFRAIMRHIIRVAMFKFGLLKCNNYIL